MTRCYIVTRTALKHRDFQKQQVVEEGTLPARRDDEMLICVLKRAVKQ